MAREFGASARRSSTMFRRARTASGECAVTTSPSRASSVHDAVRRGRPLPATETTSTRHTRQPRKAWTPGMWPTLGIQLPASSAASRTLLPLGARTVAPSTIMLTNLGMDQPPDSPNRLRRTGVLADAALLARRVVDRVRVAFPDGPVRAYRDALTTTNAQGVIDLITDQGFAGARRAAPLLDVRQILVAEIAQRGKHRVGSRLAQRAEGGVLHRPRQFL